MEADVTLCLSSEFRKDIRGVRLVENSNFFENQVHILKQATFSKGALYIGYGELPEIIDPSQVGISYKPFTRNICKFEITENGLRVNSMHDKLMPSYCTIPGQKYLLNKQTYVWVGNSLTSLDISYQLIPQLHIKYFDIKEKKGKESYYSIAQDGVLKIGRKNAYTFDSEVSGEHYLLEKNLASKEHEYFLTDVGSDGKGSLNGTFICFKDITLNTSTDWIIRLDYNLYVYCAIENKAHVISVVNPFGEVIVKEGGSPKLEKLTSKAMPEPDCMPEEIKD